MSTNTPTRIVELDYDALRQNIIEFFQSQTEFSDYNFTGSALTTLINNLAYNAHYLGFYANLGFSEKYLDSAVTRAAVVSAAKYLGYIPTSTTAASASVDVTVTNVSGSPSTLELPKFTIFSSSASTDQETKNFTFVNTETLIATKIGNSYTFANVLLREGIPYTHTFVVGTETNQIYEIPNLNVDTSTIKVRVQNSSSDLSTTTYTKYSSLVDIDGESTIFFLDENYNEKTQIQFGDNIIGKKLSVGNIIIVEYLITKGAEANGIKNFAISGAVFGSATATTTLSDSSVDGAVGGADKQTIESIKFTAPKSYVAQNRLVTTNDFYAEIAGISSIESVSVWGGEDNIPPLYGSVVISAKPIGSLYLSDLAKNDIQLNKLKPKKVATIRTLFVDPDYTFINMYVTAKYDATQNNLGIGDMESVVRTAINTYQTNILGKFNSDFLYEQFLSYIKSSNTAITSTYAVIKLQKRFIPNLNTESSNTINFNTAIQQNRLESTRFYMFINDALRLVSFRDYSTDTAVSPTSIGTLQLWDSVTGVVYDDNVGTVDYSSGLINTNTMNINSLLSGITDIRITVSVQENVFDISTYRNNILLIDDSHIDTNVNLKNGVTIDIVKV